jgi:uncharacterized protein (TIGR04255 family)
LITEQMMIDTGQPLPDFGAPPVVETALSVEFAPLGKWGIPHFGLFWNEISSEYPRFETQPPLSSQIERFGKPAKLPPQITLELVTQLPVRCWFIHKSETRLLQVQNDRFIHNWRKKVGTAGTADTYPHYENIRPIFEREWNRFLEFLRAQDMGTPEVRQCEVTYVNHIDPGNGWNTLADLPGVIGTRLGAGTEQFLPPAEAVGLNAVYILPNEQGRLRVQLDTVFRHVDAKETLQLTLTSRGRPASSQMADLLRWFDLGREWVVRGFADFTAAKMHTLWQRKKRQ